MEEEVQRAVVAFIDDASFHSNERNMENKMQETLRVCTRLCEVTSGRVEQSKSHCYAWKWSDKGGKRVIIDRPIEIQVHGEKLK